MDLQTIVGLEKPDFQVDYHTRLMMLGSCFVENIGEKLKDLKFRVEVNPCGIVYNPWSVAHTLEFLWSGKRFGPSDLVEHDGKWVSLDHHGSFSDREAEVCLQRINGRLSRAALHWQQTDVLVITWGTAWVYRYRENGKIVSNCHRFPAEAFIRFRLEADEIVSVYSDLIRRLLEQRPSLNIVFTVSPVRHGKDGAHGNQLSKAVLLLAVDRLEKAFPQVSYFPAYEIVMDELRDYRFYAEDMLHISRQGIDYIWEKFRDLYLSGEARQAMERIGKWNKILRHRPRDPDSAAYRELVGRTETELHEFLERLGLE